MVLVTGLQVHILFDAFRSRNVGHTHRIGAVALQVDLAGTLVCPDLLVRVRVARHAVSENLATLGDARGPVLGPR